MKAAGHQVCLLLGSNIQPEVNLPRSIGLLQEQLTLLRASSIWESKAVGSDGPNILNMALLALSALDAVHLKDQALRPIEAQLGRVRTPDKNSPRTIDIDIILFDQEQLDSNLWRYAHRAVPVAEVLPEYRSAAGEKLKDAAARLAQITPIWVREDISIQPFPTVS